MSFSIRFPELPPRSHDAPSFRRYTLRGRRIGWALDSLSMASRRPKFDRWAALTVGLLLIGLVLLWASVAAPAEPRRVIALETADTL